MTQCVAHSRSGRQCRSQAISGGTVCRMHGGAAPQTRAKAAQRLVCRPHKAWHDALDRDGDQ